MTTLSHLVPDRRLCNQSTSTAVAYLLKVYRLRLPSISDTHYHQPSRLSHSHKVGHRWLVFAIWLYNSTYWLVEPTLQQRLSSVADITMQLSVVAVGGKCTKFEQIQLNPWHCAACHYCVAAYNRYCRSCGVNYYCWHGRRAKTTSLMITTVFQLRV